MPHLGEGAKDGSNAEGGPSNEHGYLAALALVDNTSEDGEEGTCRGQAGGVSGEDTAAAFKANEHGSSGWVCVAGPTDASRGGHQSG